LSKHRGFEFSDGCSLLLQVGARVDLHADTESVAPLKAGLNRS
jgi:hypothetical protein